MTYTFINGVLVSVDPHNEALTVEESHLHTDANVLGVLLGPRPCCCIVSWGLNRGRLEKNNTYVACLLDFIEDLPEVSGVPLVGVLDIIRDDEVRKVTLLPFRFLDD